MDSGETAQDAAPKGQETLRQKDQIRTNPWKGAMGTTDEAAFSVTCCNMAA